MSWTTGLWNLQKLIPQEKSIGYHIHNEWSNPKSSIGLNGEECALDIAGNHYDPYFACGPASAARTLSDGQPDFCFNLNRPREDYICRPDVYNGGSTFGQLDQCEVGDLSGKYGAIPINKGEATDSIQDDPLPALASQFVDNTNPKRRSSFDEWSSIVFHRGSDGSRFLCAQLTQKPYPKCENTVQGYFGYDEGCDEDTPVCADYEGNPVGYGKKGFKCIDHPTQYVSSCNSTVCVFIESDLSSVWNLTLFCFLEDCRPWQVWWFRA